MHSSQDVPCYTLSGMVCNMNEPHARAQFSCDNQKVTFQFCIVGRFSYASFSASFSYPPLASQSCVTINTMPPNSKLRCVFSNNPTRVLATVLKVLRALSCVDLFGDTEPASGCFRLLLRSL